jgi:hypothetical protein
VVDLFKLARGWKHRVNPRNHAVIIIIIINDAIAILSHRSRC